MTTTQPEFDSSISSRMPPAGGRIEHHLLATDASLELLLVHSETPSGMEETSADTPVSRAIAWLMEEAAPEAAEPVIVPLYGMLVAWTARRAAIVADAGRLETARDAVVAFSRLEAELGRIERETDSLLTATGEDTRFGFTFSTEDLEHLDRLASQYRRAVAARVSLARVAADVRRTPPHPPTLAGQIGERLRDRLRLVDRLESLEGKAEIAEQVYATCGQRSSEFLIGRRQMTLEWIIILLLAMEGLLLMVDLLSSTGFPGGTP